MYDIYVNRLHTLGTEFYADGLMQLPNLEGAAYFGRYE